MRAAQTSAAPFSDETLLKLFAPLAGHRFALAVSGGGDSMALMYLCSRWLELQNRSGSPGGPVPEGFGSLVSVAAEPLPGPAEGSTTDAVLSTHAEWLPGGCRHNAELDPAGGPRVVVVTVDHQLRPSSADEARRVADIANTMGFAHATLIWTGDKPEKGLQASAREARYRLIGEFLDYELALMLERSQIPLAKRLLVTAHTAEDQAETLLMRLARGSGIDGLSAMQAVTGLPRRAQTGDALDIVVRPLLNSNRDDLRSVLRAAGLNWFDDPSNEDQGFERIRMRGLLLSLAEHGLTVADLVRSSQRLSRARIALGRGADAFMTRAVDVHSGAFASIDAQAFADEADEICLRVLNRILNAFGGQEPGPRLVGLEELLAWLRDTPTQDNAQGMTCSLGGCLVEKPHTLQEGRRLLIFREPGRNKLPRQELMPGESIIWDRRFKITLDAAEPEGIQVAPLERQGWTTLKRALQDAGAEYAQAIGHSLPERAAVTLPALWRGKDLVGVPHLTHIWNELARKSSQHEIAGGSGAKSPVHAKVHFIALEPHQSPQPIYYRPVQAPNER